MFFLVLGVLICFGGFVYLIIVYVYWGVVLEGEVDGFYKKLKN